MKRIAVLIAAIMLLPQLTLAATDTSSKETKLQQLHALKSYIERTYYAGTHDPLTADELRKSVVEGTDWIVASQEEDGHFAYEYAPYEGEYLNDDNIVRQAGSLYQLGEVLRRQDTPDPELAAAIESSIGYFEELATEDTFLKVTFRCIVEDADSDRCKLGASSLALMGILSYVEVYPEKEAQYEELISDLVRHIINAKRIHGTFRESHYVGKNAQPSKESSFADGEAVLALVRYYQYKETATVKRIIEDSIERLMDREHDTALYLWIMAALKDWQDIEPSPEYVEYARDFTHWRVSRVVQHRLTQKNYCAFSEGLASALSVLKDEGGTTEYSAWRSELDYWNAKNARLQIGEYDAMRYQGADGFLTIANMDQAQGGFLTSDTVLTQRIDFTQHCVSSVLQTLVDLDEETL